VELGGHGIDVGSTDFHLLAVRARHAGQVLTKARLLERVWGYAAFDPHLVVAPVSLLRRQLGPEAARLIHTARGVGTYCATTTSRPPRPTDAPWTDHCPGQRPGDHTAGPRSPSRPRT
jgi:DNA-binding response OmpR family regulator